MIFESQVAEWAAARVRAVVQGDIRVEAAQNVRVFGLEVHVVTLAGRGRDMPGLGLRCVSCIAGVAIAISSRATVVASRCVRIVVASIPR